jgi:hypothetical protein
MKMEIFDIPIGSKIRKATSNGGEVTISWDKQNGGAFRYPTGVFLFAWLGGWFFGIKGALEQLLTKSEASNNGILIFWLIGWSVGGAGAIYFLYLIFRPQKSEKITFCSDHLEYDTGTPLILSAIFDRTGASTHGVQWWNLRQIRMTFQRLQRGQVKFIHEKNPSRIYFDWDSERFEIGRPLSEPERDWLYSQLTLYSGN